ncbi:hypothetical protein GCM10020254_09140 [Streptomyces goshikiensis]
MGVAGFAEVTGVVGRGLGFAGFVVTGGFTGAVDGVVRCGLGVVSSVGVAAAVGLADSTGVSVSTGAPSRPARFPTGALGGRGTVGGARAVPAGGLRRAGVLGVQARHGGGGYAHDAQGYGGYRYFLVVRPLTVLLHT